MAIVEIKHRWTGAVLWSGEAESLRDAVVKAVAARAYLARANLAGANLADANLAGADLADANLAGANLARANLADAYLADAYLADAYLAGANLADAYLADAYLADAYLADAYLARAYLARANLAGANLADANLAGAYLARANLARAYLADAYLADANLAGADLAGADLADANLAGADLARAYLADARNANVSTHVEPTEPYTRTIRATRQERMGRYRELHPEIPVVENLDRRIRDVVTSGEGVLEMGTWHTCLTTHCRAGWAINLAGDAGRKLEAEVGPERAGRAIYRASTGRVPHFYATNEDALEDIKRCAEEDTQPAV